MLRFVSPHVFPSFSYNHLSQIPKYFNPRPSGDIEKINVTPLPITPSGEETVSRIGPKVSVNPAKNEVNFQIKNRPTPMDNARPIKIVNLNAWLIIPSLSVADSIAFEATTGAITIQSPLFCFLFIDP